MSAEEKIDKIILEKLEVIEKSLSKISKTITEIRSQSNMVTYLMLAKENNKKLLK